MNEMHLHNVDLNLLVVLSVLLEEESVSRAATRLNRTPSAVSHALARLRTLFDDELLIRDGRRMRPTDRARSLSESLPRLLGLVKRTLEPAAVFEPKDSTRVFRVMAPDFVAPRLPYLLASVAALAPKVSLEIAPVTSTATRDVADGGYDALLAPSFVRGEGLRSEPLGTWAWFVYGRPGHPAFDDWSLEAWMAYPHLQIRTGRGASEEGPVDRHLRARDRTRRIRAVVPSFTMAPAILATTDLLLTVPSIAVPPGLLERREIPFELPPMELSLFRSAVLGREAGVDWFLGRLLDSMGPSVER